MRPPGGDAPLDPAALVKAIENAGYDLLAQAIELSIEGMSCASCVGRVERAPQAVPGVLDATVNLATQRAMVRGVASPEPLLAAIGKAAYDARSLDAIFCAYDEASTQKEEERLALKRDLLLAGALALPVFVLEMGSHLIPAMRHGVLENIGRGPSWLVQFVPTTLVLLLPGRRFYAKGFPALLRLAPDMNSLVAVGTLAAYAYSVAATFLRGLLSAGTVTCTTKPQP